MISYRDVPDLDEATRSEVDDLLERSRVIAQMPPDRAQIAAWEQLAADCDRIGFPHLTTTARLSQYHLLSRGGETAEAIAAFVRLMQLVRRHSDLIDPRKTEIVLGEISMAVLDALDDPAVPLERVEKMIDLVDQEVRQQGVDRAGVHIARAALNCSRGDAGATRQWLERYRAEGSEGWRPDDPSVLQIDVPLLARFDPAAADELLMRGAYANGLDPEQPGADATDRLIPLCVLHAFLQRRQQRHGDADRIADLLLASRPVTELMRQAPPEQLVPVLENHPGAALVVVDHALENLTFDGTKWELLAALARERMLADPDGAEGRLIRMLAEEAAAAHDARGSTDVHSRELSDFWWAGMPDAQSTAAPASIGAEQWNDPDSRADLVLAAGWLERAGWVSAFDAPYALRARYQRLLESSMELASAADAAEAAALAARLSAEGDRLHCAATHVNVPLFLAANAAERGDIEGLVTGLRRAQSRVMEVHESLPGFVSQGLEAIFMVAVQIAVAEPGISWRQIEELIDAEHRILSQTGLTSRTSLQIAGLEIAAHRGNEDEVRERAEAVLDAMRGESEQLDAVDILLTVVRLTAEAASDIAEYLASHAASAGDEIQARAAAAWLCWFAHGRGEDGAVAEMRRVIESVAGEVEALGPVPGWVVLDVLRSACGVDLVPLVDALLSEAEPLSADSLGLLESVGEVLREHSPGDRRGVEFRERVDAIVRGLDGRNGDTRWNAWLAERRAARP